MGLPHQMDRIQGSLFPDWAPPIPPKWVRNKDMKRFAFAWRHIDQAEVDGIDHVAPILMALGTDPQGAKSILGKVAWKRIHASKLYENVHRARAGIDSQVCLSSTIDLNPKELRNLSRLTKLYGATIARYACRAATSERGAREIASHAWDLQRMGGAFNPDWSLRRLDKEHDKRVAARVAVSYSPEPFDDPFSTVVDRFEFTLLISPLEIGIEGHKQHHCVGSYANDASKGHVDIFRITGRERATASRSRVPINQHIQIKSACNGRVSAECRAATKLAFDRLVKARHDRLVAKEGLVQ